jgi:hypothetical protein
MTFSYSDPKHAPPRVVEQTKAKIRKYLKRERRKPLPDEVDFWDFDCRIGKTQDAAETAHVATLIEAVDTGSKEGWEQIYIEILAKPGRRKKWPKPDASVGGDFSASGEFPLLERG